jgi:plastocyanin
VRRVTVLAGTLLILALLPAAARLQEHLVMQRGKQFSVDELRIRTNETVRFVNDDDIAHNVFSRSEIVDFNVKLQEPGSSDVVKFSKPGVAEVRCAIHPQMKLRVVVSD